MLLYRTSTKKWDGPHKFFSIEGETVVVQLRHGRRIFRSHCLKPLIEPVISDDPDRTKRQPAHLGESSDETKKEPSRRTEEGEIERIIEEEACVVNTVDEEMTDDDSEVETNEMGSERTEDHRDNEAGHLIGNRRQRRMLQSLYRKWNKRLPRGMAELITIDLGSTPRKIKSRRTRLRSVRLRNREERSWEVL